MFLLASALLGLSGSIGSFIGSYGYIAIFILMVLEAASLPIPSEVVLPAIGYLAATGSLNVFGGFAVVILGGVAGMLLDYYIAYFLEKDVVYKHLSLFHIKKKTIEDFDRWFAKNGNFAVFITRLLPIVRGFINFPAGFAKMDMKKFLLYSVAGTVIWDVLLIAFGYYALAVDSASTIIVAIAAFGIVLYIVYKVALGKIRNK